MTNVAQSVTADDIREIKDKIDKMAEAINRLVLLEERLVNQGERIGRVEQDVSGLRALSEGTDRKVDMWVNRGIGVWVAVGIVASASVLILQQVVR